MNNIDSAKLLKIFVGESAKIGHIDVYEKIVTSAREANLAGATVYKGIMGFGKSSVVHTSKIFALSDDLPIVIEIIDSKEKINSFIPLLKELLKETNNGGLITIENVEVLHYTSSNNS